MMESDAQIAVKAILTIMWMVAVIIFVPLLLLWSGETLFGLSFEYNLAEWFAVFILGQVFGKFVKFNINVKA